MTTLVTGGSGVVGGAVIDMLVAEGREVRALARSDAAAAAVAARRAQPVTGDILRPSSLRAAMEGCEVVYHVAGVNALCLRDPGPMLAANIEGTRNVIRAAAAAGVRRIVYTSSAVTLGEAHGTVGNERSPHRGRFLSFYEQSKYLAERVALTEPTGAEVVVVNPSSVQGPGRATGTGKLFLDLVNGKLPAVVDGRLSVVDIEDCARGHLLAERRGEARERYVLNGFTMTTGDALGNLARLTGLELEVPRLPGPVASAGAALVEALSRLTRQRPKVCREMVRVMSFGHAYDGSRAARELGLTYRPAEETIRRTIRWFVDQGLVTRALPALS